MKTSCHECPLRVLDCFTPMTAREVDATSRLKRGELRVEPGTPILMEGAASPQLYTVLSGQGIRYKTLEDGARQVISFVFPGDFLGLQAMVMDEMQHSIDSASEMVLCVFDRADLARLFKTVPERAFDVTWIAAMEEHMVAEALANVGQQPARAKVAWGLLRLYDRARMTDMKCGATVPLPFRQQDLADALGLSLVHTNKTLAVLRQDGLATWRDGKLTVHDVQGLREAAMVSSQAARPRPLI